MKSRQKGFTSLVVLLGLIAFSSPPDAALLAADHRDAPLLSLDQQADITDVYVFQSPQNPDNTVFIMGVNPLLRGTRSGDFGSELEYQFNIFSQTESNYSFTFSSPGSSGQFVAVSRDGSGLGTGAVGDTVNLPGGGKFTTGIFDDPFFFDLVGFQDDLNFTGDDFFAGLNVSAIVLEVPTADVVNSSFPLMAVGARTVRNGVQQDRMGRPAINTILIPSGRKDAYNGGDPFNDPVDFGDDVVSALIALGNSPSRAQQLADILLPDLQTYDTTFESRFFNGRQLADDVIDAELALLTGSSGPSSSPAGSASGTSPLSDGVDANDVPFRDVFPYLARPHPIPEPATAVLICCGIGVLGRVRRSSMCGC